MQAAVLAAGLLAFAAAHPGHCSNGDARMTWDAVDACDFNNVELEFDSNNLGFIAPGSWMAYKVNIPQAGAYKVTATVASPDGFGSFQVENYGGDPVYGSVNEIPATGDWYTWTNVSTNILLEAGEQAVALKATTAGWNLQRLYFSATVDNDLGVTSRCGGVEPSKAPPGQPLILQANDYCDANGVTPEQGNLGYIAAGSWFAFTVDVEGGLYEAIYDVSSPEGRGSFLIESFGGEVVYATMESVPNTGGWYQFAKTSHVISLPPGPQTLAIKALDWGWNFRSIELTAFSELTNPPIMPPTTAMPIAPTTGAPVTAMPVTSSPTIIPTMPPTSTPTSTPSEQPTGAPVTDTPTMMPTTKAPIVPDTPTASPVTQQPSTSPSDMPTSIPSDMPSDIPSDEPTSMPLDAPTMIPTDVMTAAPVMGQPVGCDEDAYVTIGVEHPATVHCGYFGPNVTETGVDFTGVGWVAYRLQVENTATYQFFVTVMSEDGDGSYQLELYGKDDAIGAVRARGGNFVTSESENSTITLSPATVDLNRGLPLIKFRSTDFDGEWTLVSFRIEPLNPVTSTPPPVPDVITSMPTSSPVTTSPSSEPSTLEPTSIPTVTVNGTFAPVTSTPTITPTTVAPATESPSSAPVTTQPTVPFPTFSPVTPPSPPVSTPIATDVEPGPANGTGFVRASGKEIVNGEGEPFLLRGFGLGNWFLQEPYMLLVTNVKNGQTGIFDQVIDLIGEEDFETYRTAWLDNWGQEADIIAAKEAGFNSLRVALHYNMFTPPIEEETMPDGLNSELSFTILEEGFSRLATLVQWCKEAEIYLIIDLHAAPGGQGRDGNINDYQPDKDSLWENRENVRKTIALWVEIATRYKDEPIIAAYDLLNEPNWNFVDAPGVHPNGCSETVNAPLKLFYEEALVKIREVDTNHMIVIEGNCWSNNHDGIWPLDDDNLALSLHRYWVANTVDSIQKFLDLREEFNVPLWMGESGENNVFWFKEAVRLLETNNIGWAWWNWKNMRSDTSAYSINVPEGYLTLTNYWLNGGEKPDAEFARSVMMNVAENAKIENCVRNDAVIESLVGHIGVGCAEAIPIAIVTGTTRVEAEGYCNMMGFASEDTIDVGGGFNLGWTDAGDFVEYSIEVETVGTYDMTFRVAGTMGGSFKVLVSYNGTSEELGDVSVPATGDWQQWTSVALNDVALNTMGVQTLRIEATSPGWNINWIQLSYKA